MVGCLDPNSAFVADVGVAVNQALDGTLNDFSPAIGYFKRLRKCGSDRACIDRLCAGPLDNARSTSSSGRQNIAVGDMVHLRIAEGALLTLQEP